MATSTTIKITNRNPKKPVKGLPSSIEVTAKTTVQDIKNQIAKPGRWDPERMGLFETEKKKILKDRTQLITTHAVVMDTKEILVKDLGPQMAWTTVFVIEYFGPILFHVLIPLLRPYIYSTDAPMSTSQYLTMAMVIVHFLKREYETLFVHKFSLSTMPAFNIFKNSQHYWVWSGANIAYWAYSPTSNTAKSSPVIDYIDIVGLVLYVFGEVSNFITHQSLASLRAPGETKRSIPKGYGFGLVTCPNYMFEIIAWIGILLVSKTSATALFLAFAWWQMQQWAVKKEKSLRAEFPNEYKKKKYVLIPSPTAVLRSLTRK